MEPAQRRNKDQDMPKFPEFSHIRRFWMPQRHRYGVKIVAGDFYVTCQDEVISTVLGSCVTACIRDPEAKVGGINHFILPDSDILSASNRYGVFAMEQLINAIIKYGGNKNNFEIKLVGGGNMIGGTNDIGQRNIEFIKQFLVTEGYKTVAEDLGGMRPRKIMYNVQDGRLMVQKLKCQHHDRYLQRRNQVVHNDDVELFTD
ncbi:MAG: hypothetical protein HRU22_10745 [Gammaproteobacteria bacterium]|nr:hypothetical protein [Gammaproteobacteria bacterium]